jgi:hypothetical protein
MRLCIKKKVHISFMLFILQQQYYLIIKYFDCIYKVDIYMDYLLQPNYEYLIILK